MSIQSINHIVMADDDEDDFEFFRSALEKSCGSIKLSHAVNWMDILRHLNKEVLPDVIFLDLNMPIKTGLECLQLIRADDRYNNISVIIYSTSSSQKDIDETYQYKANYYIVKPANIQDMNRIVETICNMNKERLLATPSKKEYLIH